MSGRDDDDPPELVTTYPGRPNWCPGALKPGQTRTRGDFCGAQCPPGFGLCWPCQGVEVEMREALRRKAGAGAQQSEMRQQAAKAGVVPLPPRLSRYDR